MEKILTFFITLMVSTSVFAASDSYDDNASDVPSMHSVKKLIKKENYQGAIDKLFVIEKEKSNNANVYNLLGYSHRKLQRYEKAYDYYQAALKIKPKHKGANEYLGELYVETDRLAEAQQQLEILKEICSTKCKEYKQLKSVIDAHQNSQLLQRIKEFSVN